MDICFEGVGQVAATFKVDGEGLLPGMAVTLTGNGAAGLGKDGDAVCGVLLGGVRGGAAAVQIGGAAKVSYSGAAPEVGWQELVCDGEGGVKAAGGENGAKAVSGESGAKAADGEEGAKADGSEEGVKASGGGVKWLVLAVDENEKSVVIKL